MTSGLFINGRFLTQQTTGVQAFAQSICAELAGHTDFRILVPEKSRLNDSVFKNRIVYTGKLQGHLWEQLYLPIFLKKHPGSVLLNLCNTGPVMARNQVTTIHDLAWKENPAWFNPLFAKYYSWLVPRLVRNSKKIITVSETIKSELIKEFHLPEKKIDVTANKINDGLLSVLPLSPSNKKIKPGNFFLMVGSDDPRKNFRFAEDVFVEKFPGTLLVIAGGNNRNFNSGGNRKTSENIIYTGYTGMATLRWLYENAKGLINPSFYEGFGIPNLEAFAFGCPVICSDIPVFREVCGHAAFYFNPVQPESLITIIQNLLNAPPRDTEKTLAGKVIFTSFQNQNRSQILLQAIAV